MDLNAIVTELDGSPVKDGTKELTVKDVVCRCLLGVSCKEDQKLSNAVLALRVSQGVSELTADEAATIMGAVKGIGSALIVLRVAELVDPAAVNKLKG